MPKSSGINWPRRRAYKRWYQMIRRCTNPSHRQWKDYGGRGITVCARWRESFDAFYADVGDAPDGMSIDRYPDNDGPYAPGNWRWATPREQALNRRPYLNNESRKTHCPQNHPYDDANTYLNGGRRFCRRCASDRGRRRDEARRAVVSA